MGERRLYGVQERAVSQFHELKSPRRKIWCWDTGVGKTPAACTLAQHYLRVLIVSPAIVRRHWLRELYAWTRRKDVSLIEVGRSRQVSKSAAKRRDQAYAANIQIVSYDLIGEVDERPWHLIILDEMHHIGNPSTRQSCLIEERILNNPNADVLGLTATLIPTEVIGVWNPLRLLFGYQSWGRPATRGRCRVNWKWKVRYCNSEQTEYGIQTWGCRDDNRAELVQRMKPCVNIVKREDIIPELPPLDLRLLDLPPIQPHLSDDNARASERVLLPTRARTLVAWAEECAESVSHFVILVHHRDLVEELRRQLLDTSIPLRNHDVRVVTGATTPSSRYAQLEACGKLERCILVGTHDSVAEGVRMMWAQQVLIDEWSKSPGRVLQVLGRFQSVGSKKRPCVRLRTTADNYSDAEQLLERVKVVQDVLGKGQAVNQLADVLEQGGPSPDDLAASWLNMIDSQRSDALVKERAQAYDR